MPDASTLAVFCLASLALIAVPGPAVLYIVTRSLGHGRRAGLVSMLGIEAGAIVHVAAAAVGLSALLASSAAAFTALKYAGAAYLVYLGVRKLLEMEQEELEQQSEAPSSHRLFWEGALVNALNPKTAVFFLAFLPQFIDPERGAVGLQAAVLGLAFVAVALLSDSVYAFAAGSVGAWFRARRRPRQWLVRISGGVYIALGASTALTGRPAGDA